MTVDTFRCGLLHGETDTSGYPEYNAIVGGLASHWDELSGELIVRAVIGWGGKGLRGDTDRIGQKLLSSLYQQVVASGYSLGEAEQARLPSDRRPIRPDLRPLRLRGGERQRVLLPEVRHADDPRLLTRPPYFRGGPQRAAVPLPASGAAGDWRRP